MSKNAAAEGALGNLHATLATVISSQVSQTIKEPVMNATGDDYEYDDDGNVVTSTAYLASPQLLAVAAKFLKDNEITATAEQSEEVSNLKDEVAARRKANDQRKADMAARRKEALEKAKQQ